MAPTQQGTMRALVLAVVLALAAAPLVAASAGDQDPEYRGCVAECVAGGTEERVRGMPW